MSLRGVYPTRFATPTMAGMPFALRSHCDWKLRTRSLPLGERTVVMGVLNTTPDSFSDGGRFATPAEAIERALAMFDEGADIVDVGGESTRPGNHAPLSAKQEIDRVLPVLAGIFRHRPGSIVSIDTYHAETASAALAAGVEIVNDVSGFLWDSAMAEVCAIAGCGVVLTHTRGRPDEWRTLPPIDPASSHRRFRATCNNGSIKRSRQASSGNGSCSTQALALENYSNRTTACSPTSTR